MPSGPVGRDRGRQGGNAGSISQHPAAAGHTEAQPVSHAGPTQATHHHSGATAHKHNTPKAGRTHMAPAPDNSGVPPPPARQRQQHSPRTLRTSHRTRVWGPDCPHQQPPQQFF